MYAPLRAHTPKLAAYESRFFSALYIDLKKHDIFVAGHCLYYYDFHWSKKCHS